MSLEDKASWLEMLSMVAIWIACTLALALGFVMIGAGLG